MSYELNLAELNDTLAGAPADEIIRQGLALSKRPFVSTKFGPESAVLLHLLVQECPNIPVVWVDTGFNTYATQLYMEQLTDQLDLNLQIYRPRIEWSGFPPDLDDPSHQEFTQQVKLEPFQRAVSELRPDVWFCSIRRTQTEYRSRQRYFCNTSSGLLKAAPLLEWSESDMQDYLSNHRLPVENDYCDPTKGEARRECGLHLRF